VAQDEDFQPLTQFLLAVPSIGGSIGTGKDANGSWWVKFRIDIADPLAWRVVQELGHVLNYLSLNDRLPTVFMPVSPPPYLNGGGEFLSWVIECRDPEWTPEIVTQYLPGRLPRPVEDRRCWDLVEDEGA
jgi:hypothetical protein